MQLTFKKLQLIKFGYNIKKESNLYYLKRLLKHSFLLQRLTCRFPVFLSNAVTEAARRILLFAIKPDLRDQNLQKCLARPLFSLNLSGGDGGGGNGCMFLTKYFLKLITLQLFSALVCNMINTARGTHINTSSSGYSVLLENIKALEPKISRIHCCQPCIPAVGSITSRGQTVILWGKEADKKTFLFMQETQIYTCT